MQISAITLGTTDQARAIAFYTAVLGCEAHIDSAQVAYFQLPGTWLALYPRDKLAAYCGLADGSEHAPGNAPFTAITLSVNLPDESAVDAVVRRAAALGARVVQAPATVDWGGYVAWIADVDGHLWEFVFNPRQRVAHGADAGDAPDMDDEGDHDAHRR